MKLTAKNVMFILMSALLVLTVMMVFITLGRVSDFLQPGGDTNVNVPQGNDNNNSIPDDVSIPSNSTQYIPGHEHEYTIEGKVISPKCDTLGYTEYYCECGDMDFQDFRNPLGHKYGEYSVIAATCTTDGWTERTCSRCNIVEKTNPVTASHSFDEWAAINSPNGEFTQEERICYGCGITELRSSDPANTWVLRVTELEAVGAYAHYQIVVDLADNENDPVHDVYSALIDPLWFDCVDGELWIYFSTEELFYTPFSVSPGNPVVTFFEDGNISYAVPEIPDDPDTGGEDIGGEDIGGEDVGGENGSGEDVGGEDGGEEMPSDPDTETE
ncbi:MAG: hypothetical protein E7455_04580 [Ruminococcaceae bacterium]|nr:hypothetical protein [Oscillospiraceae bacterium]